jgi:hypothetical protein
VTALDEAAWHGEGVQEKMKGVGDGKTARDIIENFLGCPWVRSRTKIYWNHTLIHWNRNLCYFCLHN